MILRAFSSGCTALTGVEAISNGIPAFEKPEASNAGKTLIAMTILLGSMFLGITVLANQLGIVPNESESVVSQVSRQVFGHGAIYYALQAATALILVLAANTSYADFPRLSSILAKDGYLPRQFANRGDRLVFSNGILVLGAAAIGLVVLFGGVTHALIPLYAVGVFLAFTLSQAGMVRHWYRLKTKGWRWRSLLNGLGCLATAMVFAAIVESKFLHGAWMVLILIPCIMAVCWKIHQHYDEVFQHLKLQPGDLEELLAAPTRPRYKVLLPVVGLNRGTVAALRFAQLLSDDVTGVVVETNSESTEPFQKQWATVFPDVPLQVVPSPYRSIIRPMVRYIESVDKREPERGPAVVVLSEFVPSQWWAHLLHNQIALRLKAVLLAKKPSEGGRIVIDVPVYPKDE